MGVVSRQSVKSSIVSYLGIAIGAFNMVFIYSLDEFETFGFIQILLTTSLVLSPIFTLGVRGVILRFFPFFKDSPEQKAAFLTFSLLTGLLGALALALAGKLLILPILEGMESTENNFEVYRTYAVYIYWITVLQMLIEIFDIFIQNFRRVTVQAIFTNLIPKIIIGALIYFSFYQGYDFAVAATVAVAMNALILGCLLLYLFSLGELRFTSRLRPHFPAQIRRDIFNFALFAILGTIGNKIALQIDTLSLGSFTDEQTVGVFRLIVFAASVIDIPLRSMMRITSPLVAQHMAEKEYPEVAQLYRRSANTLAFAGFLAFTAIFSGLPHLFDFLQKGDLFSGGLLCFILLGCAKLVNMLTSINNQIIMFSGLYRYNHYLLILLALQNVFLNWLFIAHYEMGIVGAALATFLSLCIYNAIRSALVCYKFSMLPFTNGMLSVLLLSIFTAYSLHQLSLPIHPILIGGAKGLIVVSVFTFFALRTTYFPDIRDFIHKKWRMISKPSKA